MYTLREAGELLGFTRAYMMQLIGRGELRSEKRLSDEFGSQRFVSRSELERFIQAREQEQKQKQDAKRGRGRPPKVPRLPS